MITVIINRLSNFKSKGAVIQMIWLYNQTRCFTLIIIIVSAADIASNVPQSPGTCEDGWKPYGMHCYQYNSGDDVETSWPEAEFYCNRQGAFVASVHSKHENEWIRTTLAAESKEDVWIGLHRTDSSKWEGGWVVATHLMDIFTST